MNLTQWLETIGLEKYADVLIANEVDFEILPDITEDDLTQLGLPLGARRKLLKARDEILAPEPQAAVPEPAPSTPRTEPAHQPPVNTTQPSNTAPAASIEPIAKPAKRTGTKTTAIIVAIAVHVAIALLATLLVILPAGKDEPEIVAVMAPGPSSPKQEMKKKSVQKQSKQTPSAAAAAATPLAMMMKTNAMGSFTAPDVKKTITGPLGMNDGDFGSGAFVIGTGLEKATAGSGGMFGGSSSTGAAGTMYDLKQDKSGKPTKTKASFTEKIGEMAAANFDKKVMGQYFSPKKKYSFTCLAIPACEAKLAPEQFEVVGKVEPRGWIIHYTGMIKAARPDTIRFHGKFDDVLLIVIDGKPVLSSGYMGIKAVPHPHSEWVDLTQSRKIDIVIGEGPGGKMGGVLWVELGRQKGVMHPFTSVTLTNDDMKRFEVAEKIGRRFDPKPEPNYKISKIPKFIFSRVK